MPFISTFVRALIGLAALAVLYELYAGALQNPLFFPTLTAAARKATELGATAQFQRHIITSVTTLAQGLLAAALVGILAGLALGANAALRWVFGPLVRALAGVPMVALVPLTIIWRGVGAESKTLLVGLFAVFAITRTVMVGSVAASERGNPAADGAGSPPAADRGARTALAIVAGLRWGLLLGVTGLVIGEMIGANSGLGYVIMQSVQRLDMASTIAGVLVLVFLEAIEAQLAAGKAPAR
jgi:NitT/TauT family transport system permease protein